METTGYWFGPHGEVLEVPDEYEHGAVVLFNYWKFGIPEKQIRELLDDCGIEGSISELSYNDLDVDLTDELASIGIKLGWVRVRIWDEGSETLITYWGEQRLPVVQDVLLSEFSEGFKGEVRLLDCKTGKSKMFKNVLKAINDRELFEN